MSESIAAENKKQKRQKPPLSRLRIVGEILGGATAGFAVAMPVGYVIHARFGQEGLGGMVALGYLFLVVPPVYGLGSAVGVYLVGNIGKQTGSFLLALGRGFLGTIVMYVMLTLTFILSGVLIVGVERIVLWTLCVLVLLIPPIMATLGFNLTRRYKEPPSS